MSTTDLLVEHLITGILGLVWMILIVLTVHGTDSLLLHELLQNQVVTGVIYVALAYPIGIFIDNFADFIFRKRNDKLKQKLGLLVNGTAAVTVTKLLISVRNDETSRYFNYSRMRIRIARSAVVNFSMITCSASLFVLARAQSLGIVHVGTVISTIAVAGVFLTTLAWHSWASLSATTHSMTLRIWKEYQEISQRIS